MEELIIGTIGTAIGYVVHRVLGEVWWRRVRNTARVIAQQPDSAVKDPREAIAYALLQLQVKRLAKEAEKVRDAFVVNGTNPTPKVPRLDLEILEIDRDSK